MTTKFIILFTFLNLIIFAQEDVVTTVDSVDLNKYQGTWYEIAKLPNSFQDHCIKNTTANYEINGEGDIIVINRCIDEDGESDDAEGLARIVDKKTNSKLEVSFVSLFGWQLFWGDYWILGLDEDYQYVCVGTPSRKYGWILSRAHKMNEIDLEKCYQIFEKNGYARTKFELSIQEDE
jgi:apolipoprotein D and lipocalin family protein